MKIRFLGTGAADYPRERTKDLPAHMRRFSSALIDGCLLIDPGPHVLDALDAFSIAPDTIHYIINTHPHSDHFCEETVQALEAQGSELIPLQAGDVRQIGNYTVTALQANHATSRTPVHFLITDGTSTLFYGLDGAWLLYEEAEAIKAAKPDLAVLDATVGFAQGDFRIFEHNDLHMVLEMQQYLKNFIKRFCISHMARTLHTDHETLVRDMAPHQITVAYDGLEIEL